MTSKGFTIERDDLEATPLPTTLVVVACASFRRATITIENPDATQTLDVQVYRRPTKTASPALSEFEGFRNIAPGEPRCCDLDVEGAYDLEFRSQASGAGITGILLNGVLCY